MPTDFYVLEINNCHGVDPDAVAFMLSSWMRCLSDYDPFLEERVLDDLKSDFDLTEMQALLLSERVLDAIEATGLDGVIRRRTNFLTGIECHMRGKTADLKLTWG